MKNFCEQTGTLGTVLHPMSNDEKSQLVMRETPRLLPIEFCFEAGSQSLHPVSRMLSVSRLK
jgi:hypothetical protein